MRIRRHGIPAGLAPLACFTQDASLKASAFYTPAKAGDERAALDLVMQMAVVWLMGQADRFEPGLCYVAPHAQEATGDNAIPQTLASVCAILYEGVVDQEVVQSDRVYHTGADPMERLAMRAHFQGQVVPGQRYVLVDDVTNLGGTLAELSDYIQQHGGLVHDVVVLVNAGRNPALVPEKRYIRLIKERFHDELIDIFGIEPDALTANEAKYLADFGSAERLRDRLAKARKEIDRRLRSKGISRASEDSTADKALSADASITEK